VLRPVLAEEVLERGRERGGAGAVGAQAGPRRACRGRPRRVLRGDVLSRAAKLLDRGVFALPEPEAQGRKPAPTMSFPYRTVRSTRL